MDIAGCISVYAKTVAIEQLTHHQVENEQRRFPLVLVCQDVSDPLNIGAIFRLADALGVQCIYLCGSSPAPPHKRISKTARTTDRFVPYQYFERTGDALARLQAEGYLVVGLEITDASVALPDFTFDQNRRLALVLGAENHGLQPETLALLDAAVYIPMYGRNTSMNVVQACAIATYELTQRYLRSKAQ